LEQRRRRTAELLRCGVRFGRDAFSISGSLASSGSFCSSATAAARSFSSFENSFRRRRRGVELAAHAVVVDHVLGVAGQRRAAPVTGS
jgi:hypothetical protein